MYAHGWYQVAFERDLKDGLHSVEVGERQFVVARLADGFSTIDAFCPHRGAHLGMGGRIDRDAIVCPFHGYRVGVGPGSSSSAFSACAYRTLVVGGCVFVRLSDTEDNGFTELITLLDRTRYFVPGFALEMKTPSAMVIENGFDAAHFRPVHGVQADTRFDVREGTAGDLTVSGVFEMPLQSTGGAADVPSHVEFHARAFSPGLLLSDLNGASPYSILTASTPTRDGGCIVRLSLVLAPEGGAAPDVRRCEHLLRHSRAGLEKDRVMWEHMSHAAPCRYTPRDAPVLDFRRFCERFTVSNREAPACA